MSGVKTHIDLTMNPRACCRAHAPYEGMPTFLISDDVKIGESGDPELYVKLTTFNITDSLDDIRQLGNALEVLGAELIRQSEPLFMAARQEKDS